MNISLTNSKLTLRANVDGDGSPLVLVPGGLTGWQSWEPYVKIFTKEKRKVIRFQLLNVQYGLENKELPVGYSVKTESKALTASLDSLGFITPLDFIAWSYGAMISLDYSLDHPERIRTLTLIEPPAVWILRDNVMLDYETNRILNFFTSFKGDITDDMLASFLQKVGLSKPGQSPKNLPQWQQWLPFKRSLRNNPAVVAHNDDLKRLKNLNCPVLLVKGTGSAAFLHRIIDGLASNLPNARVIEMPGGHAPHIVSRDQFLIELQRFQKLPQ